MQFARRIAALLVLLALPWLGHGAERRYGPGVTDSEIRIGQTMAYSGPASAYGTQGRVELAYFEKLNAEGGINGRKVKLISLDDGYNPTKTVEQTRRLVEQDEVLGIFGSLGTAPNSAVQKYLNAKKVPQLFLAVSATKFGDPGNFPWTMGWQPPIRVEARAYARYLARQKPGAKVGILYLNDDFGKEFVKWFKSALGEGGEVTVVAEQSYEINDPTVDSQVIALKGSGADVFLNFTLPKAAAQAIRKVHDIGWRPVHVVPIASNSIGTVLSSAGLDKSVDLLSAWFLKDALDPELASDRGVTQYLRFMKQYYPTGDVSDTANAYAYSIAQTVAHVLGRCGDELTRENVLAQATAIRDLDLPMLPPGIGIRTGPTDYFPIKQLQMMRFDGRRWVRFGDILSD